MAPLQVSHSELKTGVEDVNGIYLSLRSILFLKAVLYRNQTTERLRDTC